MAQKHIRRLEGSGSKAQLILFDDGHQYVVKFKGNLQGPRVLVNELIASRLAVLLGIPVCDYEIVRVPQPFIDFEPDMYKYPFVGGLQFGSRYYETAFASPTKSMLEKVGTPLLFGWIIVFDHLINNWDRANHGDNLLYIRDIPARLLTIDHGHAFQGPEWTVDLLRKSALPVQPLFGFFYRYLAQLMIGDVFSEPLERIEDLRREQLESLMEDIPVEWGIFEEEQEAMIDFIMVRKDYVRMAITELKVKGLFPKVDNSEISLSC
jgi:hypothetical protein